MTDIQLEFSKGIVTIRVTGSSIQAITDVLDDAIELLKDAEDKLSKSGVTHTTEAIDLEIPEIISPSSLRDAISQLFVAHWGKTPRALGDIMNALQINAVHYTKQSVARELSRMIRSGILRRMKKPQGYVYLPGPKLTTS